MAKVPREHRQAAREQWQAACEWGGGGHVLGVGGGGEMTEAEEMNMIQDPGSSQESKWIHLWIYSSVTSTTHLPHTTHQWPVDPNPAPSAPAPSHPTCTHTPVAY